MTSRPESIRWVLAGRQARRFLLVAAFAVASVVLLLFLHPVILALQYGIEGWFFDRSFGRSNRGFLWSEASSALAGYVWSTWADIVRLDILPSSYSRPATRALGWHLASAIPCTLLSLLIMAPVIGRWNDPAPWRALRTTCVGLGVLYASLVAGVAMMAWDWKRLLWPARSGRRALSEGSLSPEEPLVLVLLLTPICIWFLRRLDETDDLLGLDRLVRRGAVLMTLLAVLLKINATALQHVQGVEQFARERFASTTLSMFVYLMAMLLWFDVLLLARNRESRNKRMQLGGSLCTGCGYPRMKDVERCAECGFVETEETTKPFRGPAA